MIKELFQKRLSAFHNSFIFHKQDLWGNSDAIVIHSQQEKNPNSLSSQFYLWLVGEELHDTTTIFTPSAIYFLCTHNFYFKVRSLCCSATLMRNTHVSIQLKPKNGDGFALIDLTIRQTRAILSNKDFLDDDRCCPFVVGYVEGEYPKSQLFWNCINDLEPRKFKAAIVNSGLNKMINTADKPNFDVGLSDEKELLKSVDFPLPVFTGTKKNLEDKRESNLWNEHDEKKFLFLEQVNQSPLFEKEKINLESKFERIGLRERGASNLGYPFDKSNLFGGEGSFKDEVGSGKPMSRVNENPLPTNKTNDNVSLLMGKLNLLSSSSSGKQDMLREENTLYEQLFKFRGNWLGGGEEDNSKAGNKNGDQVFKFGASSVDGKEGKSKEISKNGDQVFNFGASKLDGRDGKSKEGNTNGDQLFKFGEGKKGGDQLFKLGEINKYGDLQLKIGGKRGRNYQPQLMEENKGAKDKLLVERLTAFYSNWWKYKEEQWGKADVFVITTQSAGPVETLSRPVTSSFLAWLLDDEFPETTAVFTDRGIEFFCTKESFFRLRTIGIRMTMVAKLTVSVQMKRREEQCVDWLRKTLLQVNTAPKSGANWCPLVVGCITGECVEMEALSHSKMFEVVYLHNSITNLLEHGDFEKPESFAARKSTLPKQFQMLTLDGAKTANAVSYSELAKMKSMDDNSYMSHTSEGQKSLLEKKSDTSSTGGTVEQTKPEENMVFQEDNSSRKLADKMMLLEIKEGDMETSITKDGAEEKVLAEEQNMLCNPENSPLPQVECGEQSKLAAEGGMDYSVQPTGVTDAASENALPDDNNGSSKKDSVGSDHEDDDWTLIEMECEGQETEVAERISWKRWIMEKTGKSFGLKDEASDEAPSKRTKAADP